MSSTSGTGPLYEHSPAGEEAAKQEVAVPRPADASDGDQDDNDNDIMTDDDLPSGG